MIAKERTCRSTLAALACLVFTTGFWACKEKPPEPGTVKDEALAAGRTSESFPGADEDYFADMDYGVSKNPDEVIRRIAEAVGVSPDDLDDDKEAYLKSFVVGRNNWNVWSGGNDRFWDYMANNTFGAMDLLKTLSSHPKVSYEYGGKEYEASRDRRWYWYGLVNEPCFSKWRPAADCDPAKDKWACGNPDRWGLWLDVRDPDCPPDPFENADKYAGVKTGSRGKQLAGKDHPVGSYYGDATGILGLRLFTNPAFDEAAAKHWNPYRYYYDPDYYNDKKLVRPYRVGMSCGFCHIGPNPANPPADPENPKYENLNSNPGAQYFWIDRIFFWNQDASNFSWQLFHTSPPGALDTSFVSTDNINNPRTMNAVYSIAPRLSDAARWGQEKLAGGSLDNAQFNDYPRTAPLSEFFDPPDTVYVPRVLKDGADSVGTLGALNRVYLNIGLFSEEWLLHFKPLIGGKPITPIPIKTARKNSTYWNANEEQTPDVAIFFVASAEPDYLINAPGGAAYLTEDEATLTRGKEVFAERCARCHSSKVPEPTPLMDARGDCMGGGYLDCWNRYWEWTKTDEFKARMKEIVLAPDFLEDNFLSTELRVPVTLLETNACSPLATNAIAGDIWDNFSSQSYKELPSVGKYTVHHPTTGEPREYDMPGGGRGYTRPASLISLWSTAPYLLNNSVGEFKWEGSVEARMASFDDSIKKMLWPETRVKDPVLGDKVPGYFYRTTDTSYLTVPAGFLPDFLQPLVGPLHRWLPWLFGDGGVRIGPIPKGTPVNLIANLNPLSEDRSLKARLEHGKKLLKLLHKVKHDLKQAEGKSDEEAREIFADLVDPLVELSKCPDYSVNRGHYFGTDRFREEPGLKDEDKYALIGFLKTL